MPDETPRELLHHGVWILSNLGMLRASREYSELGEDGYRETIQLMRDATAAYLRRDPLREQRSHASATRPPYSNASRRSSVVAPMPHFDAGDRQGAVWIKGAPRTASRDEHGMFTRDVLASVAEIALLGRAV